MYGIALYSTCVQPGMVSVAWITWVCRFAWAVGLFMLPSVCRPVTWIILSKVRLLFKQVSKCLGGQPGVCSCCPMLLMSWAH